MPSVMTSDLVSTYYEDDCFAAPWLAEPDVVVLIHGIAESTAAWTTWVPHLAPDFRVVRVDLPGFGRSRVRGDGFDHTIASIGGELARLLDLLQVDRAHIVGAKFGGSVALDFAARYPDRSSTVTAVTGPMWAAGDGRISHQPNIAAGIAAVGTTRWAQETMGYRLGARVTDAQREWWIAMMASADPAVIGKTSRANATLDLRPRLANIECRSLMITSEVSPLAASESSATWHELMKNSAGYLVFPTDGYHVAATMPAACARTVHAFIHGRSGDDLSKLGDDLARATATC
jgi:pimeloyl-ACP methyl ester carboxylesterase